jgi:hypothetical protein
MPKSADLPNLSNVADADRFFVSDASDGSSKHTRKDQLLTAANTSYTPDYTGAISRTVASALETGFYVTPQDFDADAGSSVWGGTLHDDQPAMKAAQDTGLPVYLPPPSGDGYYFGDHLEPVDGSDCIFFGPRGGLVEIRAAAGIIPFFSQATSDGTDRRVRRAYFANLKFNGEAQRDTYPYKPTGTSNKKMKQAINIDGVLGERTVAVIEDCEFENMGEGSVKIDDVGLVVYQRNKHTRLNADPGIINCNAVRFIDNLFWYSLDNGFSISRSNQWVHVSGNVIVASDINGIFLGSIELVNSTSEELTLTGSSYNRGDEVTLSSDTANAFTTVRIGDPYILRDGSDFAIVQVRSITDDQNAQVVLINPTPVSLQATATSDWSQGPYSGIRNFTCHDNTVLLCGSNGVMMTYGPQNGSVHDNVIVGAGAEVDSEVFATCNGNRGSTTLTVDDASGFLSSGALAIIPEYTNQPVFIATYSSISGTDITLDEALPQTYVDELVHLVRLQANKFGVLANGWWESGTYNEYATDITIHDNTILDTTGGGILYGTSGGPARDGNIHHNRVLQRRSSITETGWDGIALVETDTAVRMTGTMVNHNKITGDGVTTSNGISAQFQDTNSASTVILGENTIEGVTAGREYRIRDVVGGNDRARDFRPQEARPSGVSLERADTIAYRPWGSVGSVSGGVMTVDRTLNVYTPGGSVNVTDIDFSAIPADCPRIVVRNGDASNTFTLKYNASKIRTPNSADLAVGPYECVEMIPISSSLVQVVKAG